MAKAKRKQKHAYDTGKPEDVVITRLLRGCGLSLARRYSQGEIDAIQSMTPEQQARMKVAREIVPQGVDFKIAGPSFIQSRIKHEGEEKVKTAIRISTLPKSLWWLTEARMSALESYQALFEGAMPSEGGSIQPRMSGGQPSHDPYNHYDLNNWSKARKQLSRTEAKIIETFLRAPDDALVGTHQVFAINSGASKLAEYFGRFGYI